MKVTKTFSLDLEVYQQLEKEKNMSLIVNSFLKHYFELDKPSVKKEIKEEKKEDTDKLLDKLFQGDII